MQRALEPYSKWHGCLEFKSQSWGTLLDQKKGNS